MARGATPGVSFLKLQNCRIAELQKGLRKGREGIRKEVRQEVRQEISRKLG
jgi:hypothetical protein